MQNRYKLPLPVLSVDELEELVYDPKKGLVIQDPDMAHPLVEVRPEVAQAPSVTYVPVTPVLLLRTELSYHTVQLCAVRLRCDEYCIPAGDRSSAVGRQGPVRVLLRSGAVASRLSVSLGSQPQYCQAAGYAVLPVRLSLRDC